MECLTLKHEKLKEAVDGMYLAQLVTGENMNIQYFYVEPGASSPEHSHHHEQCGFVYQGVLTFILSDGKEVVISKGDSYAIESDEVHAAENRGERPVEGIDVFSPPRRSPDWAD